MLAIEPPPAVRMCGIAAVSGGRSSGSLERLGSSKSSAAWRRSSTRSRRADRQTSHERQVLGVFITPSEYYRLRKLSRVVVWFRLAGLNLATADETAIADFVRRFREGARSESDHAKSL
jgi:hypothetical protein